jgi:hypothetical protein
MSIQLLQEIPYDRVVKVIKYLQQFVNGSGTQQARDFSGMDESKAGEIIACLKSLQPPMTGTMCSLMVTYQDKAEGYGHERFVTRPHMHLGSMPRKIRGYLAAGTYIDVDMRNAQPTMLLWKMRQTKESCPENPYLKVPAILEKWVEDRDGLIKELGLDRNTGKQQLISAIFTENPITNVELFPLIQLHEVLYDKHGFINLFKRGAREIEMKKKQKMVNMNGSFLARFLQDFERTVLVECLDVAKSWGMMVEVLIHDGFLVRMNKRVNKEQVETVLFDELCQALEARFPGLGITFAVKDFDLSLESAIEEYCKSDAVDECEEDFGDGERPPFPLYAETKIKFEKIACFNREPKPCFPYFNSSTETWKNMDLKELKTLFAAWNISVPNPKKPGKWLKQPFVDTWIQDINRKEHSGYTYVKTPPEFPFGTNGEPLATPLYVWTRFHAERIPNFATVGNPLAVEMFLDLVSALSGDREEDKEFFLNWLACCIQRVDEMSTMIILYGEKGTGKNTLLNILRRIMGMNKVVESLKCNQELFGMFNPLVANYYFIWINEVAKEVVNMDILKGLVTEQRQVINMKNVGEHEIIRTRRILGATNYIRGLIISAEDGKRRISHIRNSPRLVPNAQFFVTINQLVDTKEGCAAIYTYLLTRDISNFASQKVFVSEFQAKFTKMETMTPMVRWVMFLCDAHQGEDKYNRPNMKEPLANDNHLTAKALYNSYLDFVRDGQYKVDHLNINDFFTELNMLPAEKIDLVTAARRENYRYKVFNLALARTSILGLDGMTEKDFDPNTCAFDDDADIDSAEFKALEPYINRGLDLGSE